MEGSDLDDILGNFVATLANLDANQAKFVWISAVSTSFSKRILWKKKQKKTLMETNLMKAMELHEENQWVWLLIQWKTEELRSINVPTLTYANQLCVALSQWD